MKLVLKIEKTDTNPEDNYISITVPFTITIDIEDYKYPEIPEEDFDTIKENWLITTFEVSYLNKKSKASSVFITSQGLELLSDRLKLYDEELAKKSHSVELTLNLRKGPMLEDLTLYDDTPYLLTIGNASDFSFSIYKSPFSDDEFCLWAEIKDKELKKILPKELFFHSPEDGIVTLTTKVGFQKLGMIGSLLEQFIKKFPYRTTKTTKQDCSCDYVMANYCRGYDDDFLRKEGLCGACSNLSVKSIQYNPELPD